jgi:hypothetical protein
MEGFLRGVSELGTYPDKQKIDVLTMLAADMLGHVDMMQAISRTLLDAIYAVEPSRKLPLVYVVDAISKMKGGREYQVLMEPEIPQCFVTAYAQVCLNLNFHFINVVVQYGSCMLGFSAALGECRPRGLLWNFNRRIRSLLCGSMRADKCVSGGGRGWGGVGGGVGGGGGGGEAIMD